MLEERDEGRGDRDDLLGADVHVLDLIGTRLGERVAIARRDALGDEMATIVEGRVGLGDETPSSSSAGRYSMSSVTSGRMGNASALLLLELLEVRGFVEALALLEHHRAVLGDEIRACIEAEELRVVVRDGPLDLAVGRSDEAVLVDPPVCRQRADEADVRTFGGLDRADPAVVAVVDVADIETGALTRQATPAQRRQSALGGQLGQRVRLVHELAELAAAEELLHRRHDGPDVDQQVFGVALSISWMVMRSRTTRSMRRRPMRKAFWISSPLARMRRLPRWSMSSWGGGRGSTR